MLTDADDDAPDGEPRGLSRWVAPPTGWQVVALMIAIVFLTSVVTWKVAQPRHPSKESAEIGFLYDMIDHHLQAIYLASIELQRGTNADIKVFAEEIHRFQSYEIGLMERLLDERGYTRYEVPDRAMTWMRHSLPREAMPGMASDDEIDGMQQGGNDVDAWFIALMVDHHAGGADMAATADSLIADSEVSELAARMAKVQRQEIGEMLAAAERNKIDGVPPAGVTWDVYGHSMDMSDHGG